MPATAIVVVFGVVVIMMRIEQELNPGNRELLPSVLYVLLEKK
jgi:hypothetical protein